LVSFWKKMNDWAVKLNVKVVLNEAFDNPWKKVDQSQLGWWRLIQNPNYYHSSQYIFEEKISGRNQDKKTV